MNKVILMGHIGKIADMTTTTKAKILNFTLATKEVAIKSEIVTLWHKCLAFNKVAEVIKDHCKVGDKICIEGKIQYREYEVEGVKKSTTEIIVSNIEFAFTKQEKTPTSAPAPAPAPMQVPNSDNGDLPF